MTKLTIILTATVLFSACAHKQPKTTATTALSGRLQAAARSADEAQNSSKQLGSHITAASGTASRVDGKSQVILEWLRRNKL